MNKKVFTLALLAVFVLAQFSIASAAPIADVTVSVAALPTFSAPGDEATIEYELGNLPGDPTQEVLVWYKGNGEDWDALRCVNLPGNVDNLTSANGSYTFTGMDYTTIGYGDQDVVEFLVTVVDAGACGAVANLPAADTASNASTFIDGYPMYGFLSMPPTTEAVGAPGALASCNTFEYWAIANDNYGIIFPRPAGYGYSGFGGWNRATTGTFAPPAPEGPESEMLSWEFTLPSTASGAWTVYALPEDMVGNGAGMFFGNTFRTQVIDPSELEDCADFTDTAGNANEVYVRYLADLGLIAGNPDGSYGPDNTLTRAEAAVLFETANGYDASMLPTSAPTAACTFTDVSASDWFAGWVWQACDDGFMNGVGGGLFDPSNLLTRGQVVTIMNNIAMGLSGSVPPTPWTNYYETYSVVNFVWGLPYAGLTGWDEPFRSAAWTDVAIGAYYAQPVIKAYGYGVADGTGATTFSPDMPITRGEFAKWLYRALSRVL